MRKAISSNQNVHAERSSAGTRLRPGTPSAILPLDQEADPDSIAAHSVKDYSDHLRALASQRSRTGFADVDLETGISDATRLLLEAQHPDGHFSTSGSRFKAVEPTVHALIALNEADHPRGSEIDRALRFLTEQIRPDGSVQSAADAEDAGWPDGPGLVPELQQSLPPRTGIRRVHLAALALIAFAAWDRDSESVQRVQRFLARSCRSGLWGPFPEAPPSPASTALALYALAVSGHGTENDAPAAAYLRQAQRPGGWWPLEHEMWAVQGASGIHLEISRIDTNAYAMLALVEVGGFTRLLSAARAFRHLKIERRHEAARWRRPAQSEQMAIPPTDNTMDEITATLGKVESPLALLASTLWRSPVQRLRSGPSAV